jgi:hypothetical protein
MHKVQRIPYLGKIGALWQRGRTSIFHLQNYTSQALEIMLHRQNFTNVSIRKENELSWPLAMYIRTYFTSRLGLPSSVSYLLVPLFYPFLATSVFNANKGIGIATKPIVEDKTAQVG